MFFNKRIKKNLTDFISQLNGGNENILAILELKEKSFNEVPYQQIIENSADVASGVCKVKTKFNIKVFDMFENIIIKEHNNGDVKHIFHTSTRDFNKIINVYKTIFSILGEGYCNLEIHSTFQDEDKVLRLTKGIYDSKNDEIVNIWLLDNITILLQYKIDPLYEFSLFVTNNSEKQIDRSSRIQGTIFDLLKTDFSLVFSEQEDSKTENIGDDGNVNFVKYYYELEPLEFGIFDQLEIQQGGNEKDYSFHKSTNLTFYSSNNLSLIQMSEFIDKLIKMYGPDNTGTEELEIHELDLIEEGRYWTGRHWDFNEVHGIINLDNPDENSSYSVWINYDDLENGFTLTIIGFHNLIEFFVPK